MALGYFSMDLTTSSGCCAALCGSLGVDNIGKLEVCGFLTVMCARRLSGYWNKRDSTLPLRYYTIVESWVANFLSKKKGLNFCLSKARIERSIAPNWPIMGISCPQACLNTSHNLQPLQTLSVGCPAGLQSKKMSPNLIASRFLTVFVLLSWEVYGIMKSQSPSIFQWESMDFRSFDGDSWCPLRSQAPEQAQLGQETPCWDAPWGQ